MNRDVWSDKDLAEIKERLNAQILRRATFRWWDPLATPRVGTDRTSPISLPAVGDRIGVDDHTYTIEENSSGSIEPTRNVRYPAHGAFPSGQEPDRRSSKPNTSAAQINADELRNALVGLAKIQDVNLFYGRDEIPLLAFRDPGGIYEALEAAEASELSRPVEESAISPTKNDPNGGWADRQHPDFPENQYPVTYPKRDGQYVMPSGEIEGEEGPLSEENFFDDYGSPLGDGNYHPYNPAFTPSPDRDWRDQQDERLRLGKAPGGTPSASFGLNPRNPVQLSAYPDRPAYGGVPGSCNVACTGLCYMTCDNLCSESCETTCWARCGDACTSTCGNQCTGCSSNCYSSCKTKCENDTGYACLQAGAKAVSIYSTGGKLGEPAVNHVDVVYHTCQGCSYTCQFYPNKRTTCWDAGCMGKCFVTCNTACSTSCFGGCTNNDAEEGDGSYKSGHGQGCGAGCTINCVGRCSGVCSGYCVQTCWHSCKDTCADNCSWECITQCGSGCESGCTEGCKDECTGQTDATSCTGGCEASCQHGCNKNCVGIGCRSICGVDSAGSCEFNCRINCMESSCTAMCSDACVDLCTTCVGTCGWQCGACTYQCSVGCEAECNINCSADCAHSCSTDCLSSCSEECGGCSDLCYSCVGMCIGVCSFKCEVTCTNCTNNCSWWCDNSCNRQCFSDCDNRCITNCSGSCATFLMSDTTHTVGPERPPTATGYEYPHPANRWEERESFKLIHDVKPYRPELRVYSLKVTVDKEHNLKFTGPEYGSVVLYQTSIFGGVFNIEQETGKMTVNMDMLASEVPVNLPNLDNGEGVFIAIVTTTSGNALTEDDIRYELPIGFSGHLYAVLPDNRLVVVIERDIFMFPEVKDE